MLNPFETLEQKTFDNNIRLFTDRIPVNGLYYSDGDFRMITINRRLDTVPERCCVLAEELGHHFTTPVNLFTATKPQQDKYERKARKWAAMELLTLPRLVKASRQGINTIYELAECMGVTEAFLKYSLDILQDDYGPFVRYGGYIIYFDPLNIKEAI